MSVECAIILTAGSTLQTHLYCIILKPCFSTPKGVAVSW